MVVYEKVYQVTMADPVGAVGGIKKLNSSNSKYWRTRIESYLRGQGQGVVEVFQALLINRGGKL